jgi:uncharacterized protein (TIGR02611 family)
MTPLLAWSYKKIKRLIVAILGGTVVLIGIALIFLPGPAVVVIPIGLGILATEFIWARTLLHKVNQRITCIWKGNADKGERKR